MAKDKKRERRLTERERDHAVAVIGILNPLTIDEVLSVIRAVLYHLQRKIRRDTDDTRRSHKK